MAIPNVSQLTSQLALMPDDSLRNYAALHQSDPYILAMAVSEKNRRATLRQSAQAGPMAPQPTVAEQEIASMGTQQPAPPQGAPVGGLGGLMAHQAAPQPQMAPQAAPAQQAPAPQAPPAAGISALPAPNLEGMEPQGLSGGGITGYADGGQVVYPGMPQDPDMAELMQRRPLTELLKRIGGSLKENPELTRERERLDRRLSTKGDVQASDPRAGLRALENRDRAAEKVPMPDAPAAPAGLSAIAETKAVPPAQGVRGTRVEQPVEDAAPVVETAPEVSDADMLAEYEQKHTALGQEQLKGMEALQAEEKAAREAELQEFDERAAKEPLTGEKKRARLEEERGTLDKSEKVAMGNAALRGMLAVLAGTNPRRAVNLARGAAVALNSFERQKGAIDARRERINEGLDRIEELREAARLATGKERQALIREMRGEERGAKREMFGMQKQLGYDVKKGVIDTGLTMALKQREELRAQAREDEVLAKKQAFEARENALNRGATLSAAGMRAGGADGNIGQKRMVLGELIKQAQAVLDAPLSSEQAKTAAARQLQTYQTELATLADVTPPAMAARGISSADAALVKKYMGQ